MLDGQAASTESKLTAIVMQDPEIGMIAARMVECKGASDDWVVNKLVEDLAGLGRTDIVLKTDGESSIVAIQTKKRCTQRHS